MRIRLIQLPAFLITMALMATAVAAESAAETSPGSGAVPRPVILVLGDSLSAGYGVDLDDTWIALLQARLNQEDYGYRMVNASISGDTTGNGLRRLPRALDLHQPEIVIIELGGNDGLRALSVAAMQANMEKMIAMIREHGALPILAGMQIPPNYGANYTTDFAAVYPDLSVRYGVPLIPFFLLDVALDPTKMQADGIHPNAAAQPILMETVWSTLAPELRRDSAVNSAANSAATAAGARYAAGTP
jgi:acyl-CoA thioesterase-1